MPWCQEQQTFPQLGKIRHLRAKRKETPVSHCNSRTNSIFLTHWPAAGPTHIGNGDDAEPLGPEAFLDLVAQILVPLLRPPNQAAKQTRRQNQDDSLTRTPEPRYNSTAHLSSRGSLTLRSAKGMVTVRTVGGRSIARHRTRRDAGVRAGATTTTTAAEAWPRDLLPRAAAGAQVGCARTALSTSTTTMTPASLMFRWIIGFVFGGTSRRW